MADNLSSASYRGSRKVSRRQLLRSGLALTAGLGAAYLVGCGSDERASLPGAASPSPRSGSSPPAAISLRAAWRRLEPAGTRPKARRDHSLVADAQGRRVYLFGGRDDSGPLADLWAYDVDPGVWSQLSPGGGPPAARFGHNAIFDGAKERVVVFGGQAGGSFFSDVWAHDVSRGSWVQLAAEGRGPRQRYGAGAAYEPAANALFITHGFTSQGRFDDTWAFALSNDGWLDASPDEGPRPVKRCLLRTVADPERKRLLLFGGQTDGTPFLGDMWAYDLTTSRWQQLPASGPSPRNLYSAVRRDEVPQMILFGGSTNQGDSDELWLFDLAEDRWRRLSPDTGGGPAARNSHDAVWSAGRRSMLLFGGRAGQHLDDLWELTFI